MDAGAVKTGDVHCWYLRLLSCLGLFAVFVALGFDLFEGVAVDGDYFGIEGLFYAEYADFYGISSILCTRCPS